MGCLAQHAVPHGCGSHRHFHGAVTTRFMGTKSKPSSASSITNPAHPALLQVVPAPRVVPCPFCSQKPPAPGSLTPPGSSLPTAAPCRPWLAEGPPVPQGQAEKAQGTRTAGARRAKADGYSCVISGSFPEKFPPGTTLPVRYHEQVPGILIPGSKDPSLLL